MFFLIVFYYPLLNTHCRYMDNYLFWCISINELFVDFPGFGAQLGGCLCVLVVLTGKIELNVFLTVL